MIQDQRDECITVRRIPYATIIIFHVQERSDDGKSMSLTDFSMIEEGDSDDGKGSVQTRHTQTTFSSLDRKNYRQESSKMCRPDNSQF